MTEDVKSKILELAEETFNTGDDPDQAPVSRASMDKLTALHPKSISYRLDGDKPIGFTTILPTTKDLMRRFLDGEINEKELFNLSQKQDKYSALYLMSAVVKPEHRKRGLAFEMALEGLDSIGVSLDTDLFCWPFTDEGRALADRVAKHFGLAMHHREK